jgi:hypothetical protein
MTAKEKLIFRIGEKSGLNQAIFNAKSCLTEWSSERENLLKTLYELVGQLDKKIDELKNEIRAK